MILTQMRIKEGMGPCMLVNTGICPNYNAPKIIVDSQAKQDLQDMMDEEAEGFEKMMETTVLRDAIDDGFHIAAVDSSGVRTSGPGIYFEHIWKVNNRRFIKQHALIDVNTMEVLVFSITMESPGDSKVFAPLIEGAMKPV